MPCKVFQVGVFFDGTGNSKEERSTYSNVAKLHDLYKVFSDQISYQGKKTTTNKIYVTGIGTGEENQGGYMQVKDNESTGYYGASKDEGSGDLASGGGGAKRIYDTIDRVAELLDAHPYHASDDAKFTKRIIDVFGFSRGAAEARDFVNTFHKIAIKKNPDFKDVRFNFIGLYDTVGSFGQAGNDIDMKPKKEYVNDVNESDGWWRQDDHEDEDEYEPYNFHLSSSSAKKIVHLTASNELRKNFPLYSVQGAATDIELLGVHSDIGGGYAKRDTEKLIMEVLLRDFDKRHQLGKKGWEYQPSRSDRITGTFEKTRIVNNDLATVSLHLMYELATKANVPFKIPSDNIANSMLKYYEHTKNNLMQAKTYSGAQEIQEMYAHQSSTHPSWSTLSFPLRGREDIGEFVGSNTVNIISRKPMRETYPNHSGKAILPV